MVVVSPGGPGKGPKKIFEKFLKKIIFGRVYSRRRGIRKWWV